MGRTPQGVRGLKFDRLVAAAEDAWSHPARGAWIEIACGTILNAQQIVAPRKGCVD